MGELTCEEVLLGVDEVVCGLVHLDLALPRLGHVPHPRVAGYDVELKQQEDVFRAFSMDSRRRASVCRLLNCLTYSEHLGLQERPVLHAAGGVHMKQLAFDGGGVA